MNRIGKGNDLEQKAKEVCLEAVENFAAGVFDIRFRGGRVPRETFVLTRIRESDSILKGRRFFVNSAAKYFVFKYSGSIVLRKSERGESLLEVSGECHISNRCRQEENNDGGIHLRKSGCVGLVCEYMCIEWGKGKFFSRHEHYF